MSDKKRAKRRPADTLLAGNEINRLGARATDMALRCKLHPAQRTAIQACLQAYSRVQSAVLSAESVALQRMEREDGYTHPWPRQWCRKAPPKTDDELMHELPLWYLAQILKSLRICLDRPELEEVRIALEQEWRSIAAAMRIAKDAIIGGSLEARTTAGSLLKAARTAKKKALGPKQTKARLANVPLLAV